MSWELAWLLLRCVTLIGIGSLFSNIPASLVTDKYGERWAIIAAAALSILAMLLCVFAPNLWVYGLGLLLIGAASAVFNLARQKYLTEAVPLEYRARALSTLGGVMRIGVFVGPLIGALAINFFQLAGAYGVGILAVLLAGLIALSIPELVHEAQSHSDAAAPTLLSIVRDHRRVFLSLGIGVLLVGAVRASRQAVLPLWAENLGLQPSITSLIYGLSGAIDMLVFYPAGKLMDRHGRAWVAVPSMLMMGISLFLMPLTSGAMTLLLVALLIGFGNGIGSGVVMTLGADYSPARGRAQFLGIWRFFADFGAFSGPALLASVTAMASLGVGIATTGILGVTAAAVLWYWIPRTPRISA